MPKHNHRTSITRPFLDALEPRRLFAYDVAFIDAFAQSGTFSPGQSLNADFLFSNSGNDPSPATKFIVYLAKPGFFNNSPDNPNNDLTLYGGIPYSTDGILLPSIAPGQTVTINVPDPIGSSVFNGGPYQFYVFAGFFVPGPDGGDPNNSFLQNDANPTNNFGPSSSSPISITGGIDLGGGIPGGGGNPGGGASTPPSIVGDLDPGFGDFLASGGQSGVASSFVTGTPLQTLATAFDPNSSRQFALAQRGDNLALLRFSPNGSLDTGFGDSGLLALPTGSSPVVGSTLIRLPDGRLVASASSTDGQTTFLLRFASDGTPDPAFGNAGVATIETGGLFTAGPAFTTTALAARGDGSLVVAGSLGASGGSDRDIGVLRVSSAGALDTSFGTNGTARIDLGGDDTARTLQILSRDQILVAGSSTSGTTTTAVAARLTATGARDPRFGTRGLFSLAPVAGAAAEFTASLGVGRDVVYLAGYAASGGNFINTSTAFVTRITATGRVDPRFGTRGVARLDNLAAVAQLAVPNTLLPAPDGGVLLSAQTSASASALASGQIGAALARLDAAGKVLTNFGTNGVSLVLQPDAVIFPSAAPDQAQGFARFLAARDGAAVLVPGGKVRALASQADDSSGTTGLQIAQAVADGIDLAPAFDAALPASAEGGGRQVMRFRLFNVGTLLASGSAQLSLSLVPVSPTAVAVPGSFATSNLRLRLLPGAISKSAVSVTLPRSADGLYSVTATLTTPLADIGTQNNSASSPNQLTIAPRFSDLGITLPTGLGALPANRSLPVLVRITNSGNFPATGRGTLSLFLGDPASPTLPPNATPVTTTPVALSITPGRPRDVRALLRIPATTNLPPGTRLFFQLTGPADPTERNRTDNLAFFDLP